MRPTGDLMCERTLSEGRRIDFDFVDSSLKSTTVDVCSVSHLNHKSVQLTEDSVVS